MQKERYNPNEFRIGDKEFHICNELSECFDGGNRYLSYIVCPLGNQKYVIFYATNFSPPSHEGLYICAEELGEFELPIAGGMIDLKTNFTRNSHSFDNIINGIISNSEKSDIEIELLNYLGL